ncbi:hypothetical protein HanOQP8_Chr16g0616921 [Helianthus annuus]|nr:hypothetical protein HanOQP8_Chr16g0616921 [Helianthus annuus]
MNDHDNCREFFSLSFPHTERLFQKRRNRFDLLDDHIHAGVNSFATSQEIVREWKLMGEETLEFENDKKHLLKRGRSSMPRGRVCCGGEEAEHERAASQKREEEYLQRIAKLEKFAEEKVAESKASELLAEEVTVDCKWLLARAVPLIAERITGSEELAKYVYKLGEVARDLGRKEGYAEGRAAAESKEPLKTFELYKTYCVARYSEK